MENTTLKRSATFSGSRFLTLLKSDFRINGNHYLKLAIAALSCYVAVAVLNSIGAINKMHEQVMHLGANAAQNAAYSLSYSDKSGYITMTMIWGVIITSIMLTVFGSLTFSSMGNKKGRISTLMVPASMCEKFALRVLIYLVGGIITLAVGFMLALLISQLAYGGGSVFFDLMEAWFNVEESVAANTILSLGLLVSGAAFTLGSALWPRLSWLKSWIVLSAIQWIGGIFVVTGALWNSYIFVLFADICKNQWGILAAGEGVLILLFWVLAWWRFRNTQIVQLFMKK